MWETKEMDLPAVTGMQAFPAGEEHASLLTSSVPTKPHQLEAGWSQGEPGVLSKLTLTPSEASCWPHIPFTTSDKFRIQNSF